MPLIVTYLNPNMRPDLIEGENWKQLDEASPRMGTINLKSLADGHKIIVNKSAVAKVDEFTVEAWQKLKDEEEAAAAAQAKARSDAEAAKNAKAAAATLALLESKTLRGRIRKLAGRAKAKP